MSLTENEQQMLEQLEQQFRQNDPKFAQAMEPPPAPDASVRTVVGGVLITVAGFAALFYGVGLPDPAANLIIGLSGFATMVTGLYIATRRLNVRRAAQANNAGTDNHSTKAPKQASKDSYSSGAWWAMMFPWV